MQRGLGYGEFNECVLGGYEPVGGHGGAGEREEEGERDRMLPL